MLGKLLRSLFGHAVPSRAASEREAAARRTADVEARGKDAIARRHADDLRAVLSEAEALNVSTYGWSEEAHASDLPALFDLEQRLAREADTWPPAAVFHEEPAGTKKSAAGNGRFQVTPSGYIYVGDARLELAWADAYHLAWGSEDYGRDDTLWYLAIQRRGRQTSTKFWFDFPEQAQRAYVAATAFVARARTAAAPPAVPSLPDQQGTAAPTPAGVATPPAVLEPADDEDLDFETDIVGESFGDRQASLRAIAAHGRTGDADEGVPFVAHLVPEPTNRHDPNAVAVVDGDTGAMLGYLARQLAETYHATVATAATHGPVRVPAVVRGVDRLGVWIDLTSFNRAAGLPSPERLIADASTYFDRRQAAGQVEGVAWTTHHALAVEAARLGQPDVAASCFEKAVQGWLGALAFERRPPGASGLFEDYARWCRKAKRDDLEISALTRYVSDVAPHEPDSTRCARLTKRLAALRAAAADEAPF